MSQTDVDADEAAAIQKIDELLATHDPKTTEAQKFLGAQFDAGLAWVHFPVGHGGLGLSPKAQKIINERLGAAGAPVAYYRNPIGHGMSAPTIVAHGKTRIHSGAERSGSD